MVRSCIAVLAAAAASTALSGCTGTAHHGGESIAPAPGVHLNVAPPPDTSQNIGIRTAGLIGTIAVDKHDCVYLNSMSGGAARKLVPTDLVWPAGTTVGRDESARVVILDSDGGIAAQEGDLVELGGGGDDVATLPERLACRASSLAYVFTIESAVRPLTATEAISIVGAGVVLNLVHAGARQPAAGRPLRYVLNLTGEGCLWAETEGAGPSAPRVDVVWPAGTTIRLDPGGVVNVVGEGGAVIARVGGALNALMGELRRPDAHSTLFGCRVGGASSHVIYIDSPN